MNNLRMVPTILIFSTMISPSVRGENIDYLPIKIPLSDWLTTTHVQTVENCVIDCGEGCNKMFDNDMSCNAIIFDESNNVCTRALYAPGPPLDQRGTGLRVAWASSVWASGYNEERAIDGKSVGAFFHSASNDNNDETFPWLAIDLVWPEKVSKVEMVPRPELEARTHNIEVRVGNDKPFEKRTHHSTLFKGNSVCGVFEGPAEPKTPSTVTCSAPLLGRYVTLQKIKELDLGLEYTMTDLNFVEVIIDSSPVVGPDNEVEKIEILLRENPVPGECPSDHPYAYNYGYGCCSKRKGSTFYKTSCSGASAPCFGIPCLHYQYKP